MCVRIDGRPLRRGMVSFASSAEWQRQWKPRTNNSPSCRQMGFQIYATNREGFLIFNVETKTSSLIIRVPFMAKQRNTPRKALLQYCTRAIVRVLLNWSSVEFSPILLAFGSCSWDDTRLNIFFSTCMCRVICPHTSFKV